MLTINQRGLVRTSVSGTEPITLAEAKLYLRIDGTTEDSLITNLITVVREHAEEYLRRSLIDQQWRITLDDYAPHCVRLPHGPVRSIVSVNMLDSEGNSTAVDSSLYKLTPDRDAIEFEQIIYASHIQIEYISGYANVSDIPASVNHGMLSHLASLFECRGEGEMAMPADTKTLYKPHREVML